MNDSLLQAAPPLSGKRQYKALSIDPSASWVAGASDKGLVELWQMPARTENGAIQPGEGPVRLFVAGDAGKPINDVAFSPDGRWIAACSQDCGLYLWLMPGQPGSARLAQTIEPTYTHWGHHFAALSIAWERSGKRILSMGEDRRLVVFNARSGKHEILQGPRHRFNTVAVHPTQPTAASGADDDLVWVWELLPTLKLSVAFPLHANRLKRFINRVSCVAWSPDGRMLAVSGFRDRSVQLYRYPDLHKLMEFRPLPEPITALAFGADPKRLAVGSRAGHLALIDLDSRKVLAAAQPGTSITQLCWRGEWLLAATGGSELFPFLVPSV